jgi:hypothetical protein
MAEGGNPNDQLAASIHCAVSEPSEIAGSRHDEYAFRVTRARESRAQRSFGKLSKPECQRNSEWEVELVATVFRCG